MSKGSHLKSQQGVVIIEAMIAILLFSLGVLAIVGLQAAMIKNVDDAKYRTEASYIAQKRIGQMWADPTNIATYVNSTNISSVLPQGTLTVAPGPTTGSYQITVTWQQPGTTAVRNFTTTVVIQGG